MIDLGDISTNPKRFGGYGRKPISVKRWEYGFALLMPLQLFQRDETLVSFQVDGRTFRGFVFEAHEETLTDSTGPHLCTLIKIEGVYDE